MKPLISILIPTFKDSTYYVRCIQSILRQTYEALEILVTSTSNVPEPICDDRIRVIEVSKTSVWDALNDAIRQAKGDFLFFCDVDSVLSPNLLRNLAKNSSRSLRVTHIAKVEDDGKVTRAEKTRLSFVGKLFHTSLIKEHALRFDKKAVCPEAAFLLQYIPLCADITYCSNGYMYVSTDAQRSFAAAEPSEEMRVCLTELKSLYRSYVDFDNPVLLQELQPEPPAPSEKKVVYQIQSRQGLDLGNYVVREYEEGRMGLSYIFRFLKAWIKCKFKR